MMSASQDSTRRVGRSPKLRNFGLTVLLGSAAALAACQPETQKPPTLSLQEARQVTATFEGHSFVPPPRTVDDIMDIVNAEQPRDLAEIEKARDAAAQTPPSGLGGTELARFYSERAEMARIAGNPQQEVLDLEEAARRSAGTDEENVILFRLGLAYSFLGRYREAVATIEESISKVPDRRFGTLVSRYAVLATSQMASGNLPAAEAAVQKSESALDRARNSPAWSRFGPRVTAMLGRSKGFVAGARGEYAEGEELIRDALLKLENQPHQRGQFVRASSHTLLAENLVQQGRLVEAEIEARNGLKLSLEDPGRYAPETAIVMGRFISILNAQGRFAESLRMADAMVEIYRRAGAPANSLRFAQARQFRANALAMQGDWKAANDEYQAIETVLNDRELIDQVLGLNANRSIALLKTGRNEDALRHTRFALERFTALGLKHYRAAEANAILAMALAANGQSDQALAAFRASVPILLQRSRQISDEETPQIARDARLQLIIESFISLLADVGDDSAAEEAYELAQGLSGRTVQGALSASSARAAARDPELEVLVRREQDALQRIGALNGVLANMVSAGTTDPATIKQLRVRVDTLRGARATLSEAIEKQFPEYATLMNPKPVSVAQTRASLRGGESLIVTFLADDRSYVWAIPKDGAIAFSPVALGNERISAAVTQLRRALDPQATTLGDIPEFNVELAHRLYNALLAPVADGWKKADSLLVVSHRSLGQLPLSVLVTEDVALPAERAPLFSNYADIPFLARTHAVTVLPSVAAITTLRTLPASTADRRSFAGFGDPLFNVKQVNDDRQPDQPTQIASRGGFTARGLPVHLRAAPELEGESSADLASLPRLPDTAEEVRNIAVALDADLTRDVFVGRRASEAVVKSTDLSGYRVLAFATHGLVPGDLNGLHQPALAMSSPTVVGGNEDGLLTMGEILELSLDADWVVLSACNTASGNGAGAEAISGLGRAFFYAGTRALLVSNWPVETTSARLLTSDIFERQAAGVALTRAEALRQSMESLIERPGFTNDAGDVVFSYAHPIFWAPFSLIGDGGAHRPVTQ